MEVRHETSDEPKTYPYYADKRTTRQTDEGKKGFNLDRGFTGIY